MAKRSFQRVAHTLADSGPKRIASEIMCAKCGEKDWVTGNGFGVALPEEQVAQRFKRAGWGVGVAPADDRCPACLEKEKLMRQSKPKKETIMVLPEMSPEARRKIPDLYLAFDDAYDHAKKTYKPGYSDERLAKELGFSPLFVAARREQDIGPLTKDTFVDDLAIEAIEIDREVKALDAAARQFLSIVDHLKIRSARFQKLSEEAKRRLSTT